MANRRSRSTKTLRPYESALKQLEAHYLLGPVVRQITFAPVANDSSRHALPAGATCQIDIGGTIYFQRDMKLPPAQWLGVLSLAVLVFASGAARRLSVPSRVSDLSAQLAALYWWHQVGIGELPEHIALPAEFLQWGRLSVEEIVGRLNTEPSSEVLDGLWTLTRPSDPFLLKMDRPLSWSSHAKADHEQLFAQALVDNARRALQLHHAAGRQGSQTQDSDTTAARARRWLISHYPLLGSLLTSFELVEDAAVCDRMRIGIAAIQISTGEIYVNPRRQLTFEQAKFVMAHEILHAGLNHTSRRQGRDAYLWNVACDFVINDWLVSMGLGIPPDGGLLFDEELRGLAAEDIYLNLAAELRVRRRLSTFRGDDVDMLDDRPSRDFTDREEFCRRALSQGLDYHQASGRGLLPASLVETIRVLAQPAIPWQAKLAEWIRERCPLPEWRRSWARPSRRQSATPDIPRPRWVDPEAETTSRTFGVIVDTSGSMDRADLGKALGAIVAYSQAQEVRQVRLVYCDAAPYDEGFVDVEALASRVSVRGRGGTMLQAAVSLLERQRDFPKDCPILIITDGDCEDDLAVARDHAFLISPGKRLPFVTRKPIFWMD